MIRLIVNADDLGHSPPRDRGIFAAFAHGIVTSASLLANGASFAAAAAEAHARALPVGVHLNLSEERALAGPIPGLTDADGTFPGKAALRVILLAGTFDRAAVRRELLAQIDRVRSTGLVPDHLDTHQHCMLFPALTGLVAGVAASSGIIAVRLPRPVEPAGLADEAEANSASRPGRADMLPAELALYRRLAPAARQTLQRARLWSPDGLYGMGWLNRLDTGTLAAGLAAIPAGTWELMTHPGRRDPLDPFGGPQREAELAALTAPSIRQLVERRGVRLTTFGACACAC
jgi:predicted glycoside hydrolase/deacetylase ChbG (UPF0249 family)